MTDEKARNPGVRVFSHFLVLVRRSLGAFAPLLVGVPPGKDGLIFGGLST
ncbi:MAG: hypothetical protein H6R29_355, partial [Methanomicrobia archaeon]|nr:hypothetical protein [Methanomicrobia archaeon]